MGPMSRKPGGKTIELNPELNARFEAACKARGAKRGFLGGILLNYALKRIDPAIDEWQNEGIIREVVVPIEQARGTKTNGG
jgi:hypothetical protein